MSFYEEDYAWDDIDYIIHLSNAKTRANMREFNNGGKAMRIGVLNFMFLMRIQYERSILRKFWNFEFIRPKKTDVVQRAKKHKMDPSWMRKTQHVVNKKRRTKVNRSKLSIS